jgi:hypothetical protein
MIGSAEQKTLMKIIKIMETKDTKGNKVPIDPDNKSKHHLTGDGSAQSNPRNIILMTTITMIKYKGIWSSGIILSRGRGPRVPFSECPKLFGFPFFSLLRILCAPETWMDLHRAGGTRRPL